MSETVLLWIAGLLATTIGALIAGMWSNLSSRIADIAKRLERHVGEETEEMWEKVDEIKDLVRQGQILNTEGHAVLGERLARMETKLPNGELIAMRSMLETLVQAHKTQPRRAKR